MIELNGTLPINDTQKWVYVTLIVDGDECQFTHVAPAELTGTALQVFIESREDAYKLDILRDMYPGAIVTQAEEQTPLEAFEEWVSTGYFNTIEDAVDVTDAVDVITKVPWTNVHPDSLYQLPVLDFMKLFTDEETVGIYSSTDVHVRIFLAKLSAARQIDFRDTDLMAGVSYLVTLDLLTTERAEEIMAL